MNSNETTVFLFSKLDINKTIGYYREPHIGTFIIPKGTKFFINYDKEYVSETIKFDGFEGKWPINTMSLSYCKILEILGLLENI